jgi:hypothetical protein
MTRSERNKRIGRNKPVLRDLDGEKSSQDLRNRLDLKGRVDPISSRRRAGYEIGSLGSSVAYDLSSFNSCVSLWSVCGGHPRLGTLSAAANAFGG